MHLNRHSKLTVASVSLFGFIFIFSILKFLYEYYFFTIMELSKIVGMMVDLLTGFKSRSLCTLGDNRDPGHTFRSNWVIKIIKLI